MKNTPNLDYGMLRKALPEVAQHPEEGNTPSRTRRSVPTQTETTQSYEGEFDSLVKEIEDLEAKAYEASENKEFGKMRSFRDKIDELKEIMDEAVQSDEVQDLLGMGAKKQQIVPVLDRMIGPKRKYQRTEGIPNLARQLEDAIKEERFDDAAKLQQDINRLKKMDITPELVKAKMIEQMVVTADNLDLVQPDKPYDQNVIPQSKQHRLRFRNEPGGRDELMWEGMEGYREDDKGVGTDSYHDVGSPASISLADAMPPFGSVAWQDMMLEKVRKLQAQGVKFRDMPEDLQAFMEVQAEHDPSMKLSAEKPKLKPVMRPQEVNLPGEKMERDPMEERQTTETWREYNDMQAR